MNNIKKTISLALAVIMAASVLAVAAVSVSAASLKKPTGVKAANYEKSIKISWKKVKGAKKYKIYRNKKAIKTTDKTNYKDFSVNSGKKYTYKIKAVNGKKTSKASKSVTITRMNYTFIKTAVNENGTITLTWNKRAGANQYKLYRKTSGNYSLIKKTTAFSYSDKNVVSGTKYTYKIVCYNTKTKSKSQDCTAKTITYLSKVTGVYARENTDGKSISLKWDSVKGAASYDIYRIKACESSYKKLASTSSTKYTDTKLITNPTAYMYKIIAVKNGSSSADSDIRVAAFLPKRDGVNSYYFDDNNNLHITVKLNKGDVYGEGKALSDFYSLDGLYTAQITSGEDVISLNDSVITANKSGNAVVEVKVSDGVVDIVNAIGTERAQKSYEKALTRTTFVEVEVA